MFIINHIGNVQSSHEYVNYLNCKKLRGCFVDSLDSI